MTLNKALIVILAAVTLDAIGIGLIFPILPALLRDVGHTTEIATLLGLMLALYSAMQFLFSPVLGVLSDRFGRRPVLLISLAGAALDYLIMAFAPDMWMLVVGRAIAGLTSANMAVATAYITDISSEEERAKRFGYFHAMFGIGFIIGPVLGGVLGDYWVRAPFIAAAVLNAINFSLALFVLPESRAGEPRAKFEWKTLNPFIPLKWALTFKALIPMMAIFVIMNFVGTMYGTVWALFGEDNFQWTGVTIGLSLGAFGVFHAGAQAFLTGPAVARLGERWALVVGMACELAALVILGFTTQGWVLFAMAPLFALGGIGMPALQSLTTAQVGDDKQGQLQGVLASLVSLAAVFGPLVLQLCLFRHQAGLAGADLDHRGGDLSAGAAADALDSAAGGSINDHLTIRAAKSSQALGKLGKTLNRGCRGDFSGSLTALHRPARQNPRKSLRLGQNRKRVAAFWFASKGEQLQCEETP